MNVSYLLPSLRKIMICFTAYGVSCGHQCEANRLKIRENHKHGSKCGRILISGMVDLKSNDSFLLKCWTIPWMRTMFCISIIQESTSLLLPSSTSISSSDHYNELHSHCWWPTGSGMQCISGSLSVSSPHSPVGSS